MPKALSAFGYNTVVQPIISSANLITGLTLAGAVGTSGQVLTSAGSGLPTWSTIAGFTFGTPVATTSGTAVTVTGIPTGTKMIIISLSKVSTDGTSRKLLRIGTSAGVAITGYLSASFSNIAGALSNDNRTDGFIMRSIVAAHELSGQIFLTLENSSLNRWAISGSLFVQDGNVIMAGIMTLSGELDRVQFTTDAGTDTYDLGEIRIAYM